jgi:Uma2 family endonuclease
MHIGALLMPYAKGRGYIAGSQAGFRMLSGNIRCPDVSFTLKARLPDGRPTKGFADVAPDLTIEILSPSEEPGGIARKTEEYFASGAQQVWHLDPEHHQLKVFRSRYDSAVYEPNEEVVGGDLLPGFRCRVSELFSVE